MILEVIVSMMCAVMIAGGVMIAGLILENIAERILRKAPEDESITIEAARLGRELAVNPRSFQSRYHMKMLLVNGTITSIQIVQSSGSISSIISAHSMRHTPSPPTYSSYPTSYMFIRNSLGPY